MGSSMIFPWKYWQVGIIIGVSVIISLPPPDVAFVIHISHVLLTLKPIVAYEDLPFFVWLLLLAQFRSDLLVDALACCASGCFVVGGHDLLDCFEVFVDGGGYGYASVEVVRLEAFESFLVIFCYCASCSL